MLIRRYRFKPEHVTLLLDGEATRERILAALGDAWPTRRVKKEDRVFVFFAGHGMTRKLPRERPGLPGPGRRRPRELPEPGHLDDQLPGRSDAIPAKHLFLVMDACYSGLALTRGGPQQYLREITGRVAREVLTAGGADEQVADNGPNGHSIFTWTLLQGLEAAPPERRRLHHRLRACRLRRPPVSSLSRQTPAFGSLAGSEGGEFVFELTRERVPERESASSTPRRSA